MFDMPSLSDAVGLRNRIIELETEVKALKVKNTNSRKEISRLRSKAKILKPAPTKQKIMQLLERGYSPSQIRDEFGFSYRYVINISCSISSHKKTASS